MHQRMTNPLIRQVRRHGTLATLFRLPASEAVSPPRHTTTPVMGRAVAPDTTLLSNPVADDNLPSVAMNRPMQPLAAAMARPSADATFAQTNPVPTMVAQSQLQRESVQALPVTRGSEPTIGVVAQRSVLPTSNAGTPPITPPLPKLTLPTAAPPDASAIPTGDSATPDAEADPNWQRLQSIMRRHREVNRGESGPPTPTADSGAARTPIKRQPVSDQRAAVVHGVESVQSATIHVPSMADHPISDRSAAKEPSVQHAVVTTATLPPTTQSQPVQRAAAPLGQSRPTSAVVPPAAHTITAVAPAEPVQVGATLAHSIVSPPDKQSALDDDHLIESPSPVQSRTPTALLRMPAAPVSHAASAIPAVAQRSLDLTTARDASDQRHFEPQTSPQSAARAAGTAPTHGMTADEPLPLEAVWPVQRLPVEQAVMPPTTAAPDSWITLPDLALESRQLQAQLQTMPTNQPTESAVHVMSPRHPRPARVVKGQATPSATTLQRQAAILQDASAATSPAPELVPTVIGPLPADLWQLIGQTPQQVAEAPNVGAASSAGAEVTLPNLTPSMPSSSLALANDAPPQASGAVAAAFSPTGAASNSPEGIRSVTPMALPAVQSTSAAAEPAVTLTSPTVQRTVSAAEQPALQPVWPLMGNAEHFADAAPIENDVRSNGALPADAMPPSVSPSPPPVPIPPPVTIKGEQSNVSHTTATVAQPTAPRNKPTTGNPEHVTSVTPVGGSTVIQRAGESEVTTNVPAPAAATATEETTGKKKRRKKST